MYAEQLQEIQAEELELAIMVSDMPHAEEKDRKSVFRRISRLTQPDPPAPEPRRRFRRARPATGEEKAAGPINEQAAAAFGFQVVRGDRKPPEPKKEAG
jgi:hypothetical protein